MKLGFIGLGKMGSNMVERLLNHDHQVVAFNRSPGPIKKIAKKGAEPADSVEDLVSKLPNRKIVWLMVPEGIPVDKNIDLLKPLLKPGDIIINGGNSHYKETMVHATELEMLGIHYLDCGTSGGVWGLKEGYSLMSGGNKQATDYVMPIFMSLAPVGGYTYCGHCGAGHFVKMVHNGIEYGIMQSYAEGFELLQKSHFDLNLTSIASGWRKGSVVRSWLLDLIFLALKDDPELEDLKDFVQDSGEGRWTIEAAMDHDVPATVISAALFARFRSRQEESFAMKILAALRNQFGGHSVQKK